MVVCPQRLSAAYGVTGSDRLNMCEHHALFATPCQWLPKDVSHGLILRRTTFRRIYYMRVLHHMHRTNVRPLSVAPLHTSASLNSEAIVNDHAAPITSLR